MAVVVSSGRGSIPIGGANGYIVGLVALSLGGTSSYLAQLAQSLNGVNHACLWCRSSNWHSPMSKLHLDCSECPLNSGNCTTSTLRQSNHNFPRAVSPVQPAHRTSVGGSGGRRARPPPRHPPKPFQTSPPTRALPITVSHHLSHPLSSTFSSFINCIVYSIYTNPVDA